MSNVARLGTLGLLLTLALIAWHSRQATSTERVEVKSAPPQAAPPCPWREPQADLQRFFPSATQYQLETLILSGARTELAQRLGRIPTGDENALHLYRALQGATPLGCVLTRRVKGEHGAIELVLGIDSQRRVCGARLQRLREPEPVASALGRPEWLGSFIGKNVSSAWKIGVDLPQVPSAALPSAEAIVEGARSLLVLASVADHMEVSSHFAGHH